MNILKTFRCVSKIRRKFFYRKNVFFNILPVIFLSLSILSTTAFAGELGPVELRALDIYRKSYANEAGIETRVAIARNFLEIKNGNMDTDAFYKELSKMEMFEGLQPRHALMKVKKDIGECLDLGQASLGKDFFFGKELSVITHGKEVKGGGSEVEKIILEDRRKIVMDAVEKVLSDFKGRNVIDGVKFSVYLAEIGGWASELPEEMKLAGDIDFSFFCGDVALAAALKEAYDTHILKTYGFGLCDMYGNVYQWIEDCYETDGASLPTDGSAVKSGNCAVRGFRANSFESNQKSLRSANRAFAYSPDTRGRPYLGFRVAKMLD